MRRSDVTEKVMEGRIRSSSSSSSSSGSSSGSSSCGREVIGNSMTSFTCDHGCFKKDDDLEPGHH